MFGIGILKGEIKTLQDEVERLNLKVKQLSETSNQDEMELRKEIGRAIEALINGESDEEHTTPYFRMYKNRSDFMGVFNQHISHRVHTDVRKNLDSEFKTRLNETFIDEIVERINRKQIGK